MQGCGLPSAWAGQSQWRVLETGFGLGLNFLATWRAWLDDPQRCRLLHFVSLEAWPVSARDLLRSAAADPELAPLVQALAAQWFGLGPGVHRLEFEQGRVLLTLCIRDVKEALRRQAFIADSLFLDGFDPQRNPDMWDLHTLKAASRHCRRGTRVATWTVAADVRRGLAQCGFEVTTAEGLASKRHRLQGVFAPAWEPRRQAPATAPVQVGRCVVIGGGLAGSAAAASLARRGWSVRVLDAAERPASGASGLPAGLLAPHHSLDDNLLSRLTRSGVRLVLQQATTLLRDASDWRLSGVLEHRAGPSGAPPVETGDPADPWTRPADPAHLAAAWLDKTEPGSWHEKAGWIKPAALIGAWLAQPGISWRGGTKVDRVVHQNGGWQLIGPTGAELAEADLVVVAAALASEALVGAGLPLQPVRGQVSWGSHEPGQAMPPFPVNGNGHFIPHVPVGAAAAWFCGSTYQRGDTDLSYRAEDHQANLQRLHTLLPAVAAQVASAFADGSVRAWTGVRCASADRRPLLGEVAPGLWVSTAMGSRGLTFAYLCAELLAGRVHGEPLPLEDKLAQALDARRGMGQEPGGAGR